MKNQPRIQHGGMLALATIALVLVPRPAAAGHWGVNSVSELVTAINAANQAGGANTITLARGMTFTLTAVNNTTDGPTGLPVIAAANNLTILGNGATIARSTAPGTPAFRLFDVAAGAALTLENLTLANGLATGTTLKVTPNKPARLGGSETLGGGILNMGGSLVLDNVIVVNNQADAGALGGVSAGGGGVANVLGATLTVTHGTFQDNAVLAGTGDCFGGGILNDAGSILTVEESTFSGNLAVEGFYQGSFGGAIANGGGSQATVSGSLFQRNEAVGAGGDFNGSNPPWGCGCGGGISSLSWSLLNSACTAATLTVSGSSFIGNQAVGGQGNDAGSKAVAGGGGQGLGSAIITAGSGSSARISSCVFTDNRTRGGAGGNGGTAKPAGATAGTAFGTVNVSSANLALVDSRFIDNQVLGGAGGNGSAGGRGGDGGWGWGGAITVSVWMSDAHHTDIPSDLVVSDTTFKSNRAIGGLGGNGSTGGLGGDAEGGGIKAVDGSTVNVSGSTFVANQAIGSHGGAGANGKGGDGYFGVGGGINAEWGVTLHVSQSTFSANQATGGNGGTGANGMGGNGGAGAAGGLNCGNPLENLSTGYVTDCRFADNLAQGGAGAAGGAGGDGTAGGIFNGLGTFTLSGGTLMDNQAIGGAGGTGANGGPGWGGGFFNAGTATVIQSRITGNEVEGGTAGSGGLPGPALGGGVYNAVELGATISIDALTVIFGNKPDDCFGCP